MARVVLGESRLKARRRRRRILLVSGVCAGFLLFVGGSVVLARASFLRIHTVSVSGAFVVPAGDIQTAIQQDIAGDYLFVYPKNNILLYPKNVIVHGLLAQFPTFKTADVHATDFHTVAVDVVERQPVALWCQDASSSSCFFIDQNGLVYAPAPDYSGDAYKKYVDGTSAGILPWQYLVPTDFHSLTALVDAIAKSAGEETVSRVAVDANNDAHITFRSGFVLLFALHDDSGKIFERFSLALTAAPFAAHPLAGFEYLDLRFGDKLYYKLR